MTRMGLRLSAGLPDTAIAAGAAEGPWLKLTGPSARFYSRASASVPATTTVPTSGSCGWRRLHGSSTCGLTYVLGLFNLARAVAQGLQVALMCISVSQYAGQLQQYNCMQRSRKQTAAM